MGGTMLGMLKRALAGVGLLVTTCAAAALAQEQADAGLFRLFQAGRELGRETFRFDARTFESTMSIPLINLKLHTRASLTTGERVERADLEAFDLTADTLLRRYSAVADGDSLRLTQTSASLEARRWSKAAAPEAVVPAQSVAAFVALVERAGRRDRTYRTWFPESDTTLAVTVAFRGDTADVALQALRMTASLSPAGRVQVLDIPMQRVRVERFTGGLDNLPPLAGMVRPTPDYTAPAGMSYTAEEVRVPVGPARGDTFSLACTLTKPKAGGPRYPVVVTVTGSGQQDRDESLWPLVPDYRVFRQVAVRLADEGIAVLRCDDRQAGGSTGRADSATTEDFANDAEAQIAWVRARRDVDPARVAVIGHSEGGLIGPMLAARDPRIAAVVVMAGTAKNGVEVLKYQRSWPIETAPGLTGEERARLTADAVREVVADTLNPLPWLRWFRAYEPLPTARRVRQPALIVQGALDRQVTAGQADSLGAAMRAGGNRDVTVRVFPRLNHLFLVSETDGSPAEYAALTDVAVPADVLDTIAVWLRQHLRR
jgi:hypothetical protein